MNPAMLGLYVSMACCVHSAMMRMPPMVSPPYAPPPMIPPMTYGYGEAHAAGSAFGNKWHGGIPQMYQNKADSGGVGEQVLLDDHHEQQEDPNRAGLTKEALLNGVHQENDLVSDGLDKKILLDDNQQKEVLNSDGLGIKLMSGDHQEKDSLSSNSHPIQGLENLRDRRKKASQNVILTAPIIEPPMQRTEYTKEQMDYLIDQLPYQTNGFDYKYDLKGNNFFQMDKANCDCSGFCGRMRIYDSVHPDQLLHDTGCCYWSWHMKGLHQANLGENCLALAIMCPFSALNCVLKAISSDTSRLLRLGLARHWRWLDNQPSSPTFDLAVGLE